MAAKTFDPTANPFELLANAENQSIVAPERRKKAAANKAAVEEPVGVVPTPAAKAQARAAKEAAKSTKPDGSPADNQGKQEPAKKKLTREQFEEEKRKGNNLLGEAPAGSSDVSTSSARPPRARGEGGVAGRGRGGGRGRGEGRGRGRGRGDGQGRGSDDKAGGGRGDKDKDHHYQPPVHGRDYDKKSMAKTSKNAPFKKGGSGSGGNYGTTQDDLAGQTGVDNVDQPTDDADKDNKDNKDNKKNTKKNDGEEESEEDNGVLYAEYQKQKAALDAALLAKIGGTAAPRKVEGNLAGTVTKVDEDKKEEKKVEKPKVDEKVGGMKIANVEDFFHVRAPPVIRGEGRGRGRGRGGRGRGRGRGGDGDATEAGTVEGEQQTSETDQSANQSNQQQGSRGRGGRGERGDSNRGQGRGGRGQGRGDRGQGRGGRGQGRGDSNGRGQGSGRGGRGGRRPNLDTSNTRHFPDLGSN